MNILLSNKVLLENILLQYPPNIIGFKKDKLYYLISKVYRETVENKIIDNATSGVHLCSSILQKVIGEKYGNYLDYLIEHKIFQRNSQYKPGEQCRQFYLNPLYLDLAEWHTITDFTFKKRLLRNKRSNYNRNTKYLHLQKWFKGLQISYNEADEFIMADYQQKLINPALRKTSIKNFKHTVNPVDQLKHSQIILQYFKLQYNPFVIDNKGKRLYTILTATDKKIRNFITYKGQPLVSIDLKNSQPFLLICFLNSGFWQKKMSINTKIEEKTNKQTQYSGITLNMLGLYHINRSFIMLWLSSVNQYSIEFQRYVSLVSQGLIYEYFNDILTFTEAEIKSHFTKRDLTKFKMMLCLYSKNGSYSGGMKSAFKSVFPKIYQLICLIKKEHHNCLAILLQRIESFIIIEVICKRVSKEYPELPIFTIHDCIVTLKGKEEILIQIINEEMIKMIGIAPKLSYDFWDPNIAWNNIKGEGNELLNKAA